MNKKIRNTVYITILLLSVVLSYNFGFNNAIKKQIESSNKTSDIDNNSSNINDLDYNKITDNVDKLVDLIDDTYLNEYNKNDMEVGIYKGVVDSLKDPYSVFFSKEEFKALNEQSSGHFGGVGIQVNVSENNYIEVIAPIKNTPADKAGIKPGDIITHINEEAFSGDQMEQAVKIMRGEPGTEVNLTILRRKKTQSETLNFDIVREDIEVESVQAEIIDNNIGYILLTNFQETSSKEFSEAINDLKAKGAKKFILDLRNNPGGLLNTALEIADILMDDSLVISVKDKNGKQDEYKTGKGMEDFELVTIINEGSASASEVLSGALKDNNRSKIVGNKSYGKGVIQQVYPTDFINPGEGVKITVAEFFRPNGEKINKVGITPDYEVDLPEDIERIGIENKENDTQLQKAIELLK